MQYLTKTKMQFFGNNFLVSIQHFWDHRTFGTSLGLISRNKFSRFRGIWTDFREVWSFLILADLGEVCWNIKELNLLRNLKLNYFKRVSCIAPNLFSFWWWWNRLQKNSEVKHSIHFDSALWGEDLERTFKMPIQPQGAMLAPKCSTFKAICSAPSMCSVRKSSSLHFWTQDSFISCWTY